MAILSKFKKL